MQRGGAHREWYANGSSSRRLEASWCRNLLAVEFSILELCPASLWWRRPSLWRHGGLSSEAAGFTDRPPPCPSRCRLTFSAAIIRSLHLRKVKLTHFLYPRPSRLSSALQSAPISSSAPNPPLTPLIALQQTAHSPHHRLISSAFSCRETSHLHPTYPYPAQNPPCCQPATNRVWRSSREVGREMSWRRNGGARTQHSKRCVIFGLVF